jgi:hydroxymethylbilane synthase
LPIRGNVGTRLQKVAEQAGLDATILAAAGMARLGFVIFPNGRLKGPGVPEGLLASPIEPEEMLPCVGQGAIGIERRAADDRAKAVCEKLNHFGTWQSVTAERAFLRALGGGCQSPVGAYATVAGHLLVMQTVLVAEGAVRRAEGKDAALEPARLGESLAARLLK